MIMSTEKTSVPFLLVSWTIPPTASGSSVVVRNLLGWFTPDEAVMLGQIPFDGRIDMQGIENHHRVVIPSLPIHWRIKPWLEPFFVFPVAIWVGCSTVRKHKLKAVVAVFPNELFLIAGYIIALVMGLPFFPYFHNLYIETRKNRVGKFIARMVQEKITGKASDVFCMSEGMSRYMAKKYRLQTTPLIHPLSLTVPQFQEIPVSEIPLKVGLSGNLNAGSERVWKNIIRAIGDDPDFILVIHTPAEKTTIRKRLGVWSDNIIIRDEHNTNRLVESLGNCDVLIIGLYNGWGDTYENDCATQFPTRTIEMLVSGKPILVLCPSHYFLATFFTEKNCGQVLDSEDPMLIRDAINQIGHDKVLRTYYVQNSLTTAQYFDGSKVAVKLHKGLCVHSQPDDIVV
jgi:hypothetical protein